MKTQLSANGGDDKTLFLSRSASTYTCFHEYGSTQDPSWAIWSEILLPALIEAMVAFYSRWWTPMSICLATAGVGQNSLNSSCHLSHAAFVTISRCEAKLFFAVARNNGSPHPAPRRILSAVEECFAG